ncbi:MAG: PTS sugar transporter subunit IIA [Chlamydiota bacterium]
MDLKIKDVAELLNVSETTIRRWLRERIIPAYKLNHQYRFDRDEIQHWMMSRKLKQGKGNFLPERDEETIKDKEERTSGGEKRGIQQFSLYRAIHRGGILTDIEAGDKAAVIRQTMEAVASDLALDPSVMTELLLDREKLMPTALNHGIAVPHTRDFLFKGQTDVVVVVFPKEPIDWGALDQQLVKVLFFLFACDDKRHLHLLAKLAHLSSNDEALELLLSQPNKQELFSYIKAWEAKVGA